MLENFPLFCSKYKKKNLINVQRLNMSVIKEPDAKIICENVTNYRLSLFRHLKMVCGV
ncbi:cysteine-rich KTR domain-containing protein [Shouchella clausii]|uniref:cysteine-rich KTR domain-containing protein n=1 Tax=Shouchella clausii TaxID=79880 RepID=UPI000BA7C7A5|nr:cysteine-rich KTR domain-containing protein [Shouchella clausii]PAE93975.1 hypothetical protein CHH70_09250 [Shouchella clausii]